MNFFVCSRAHDWNVDWAIESLAPKEKSKPKSSSKADKGMYINKRWCFD